LGTVILMSEAAPFYLIIVDEDRKQFTVEGPLRDKSVWKSAIDKARTVAISKAVTSVQPHVPTLLPIGSGTTVFSTV
jgi:hypothetical protein